jgi:hypothetical protein
VSYCRDSRLVDLDDPLEGRAENAPLRAISISAPHLIDRTVERCDDDRIAGLVQALMSA